MLIQDRVIRALREGAETSYDVEAVTGIGFKSVSGTLSNLFRKGVIRHVGKTVYPRQTGYGNNSRPNWRYEVIK